MPLQPTSLRSFLLAAKTSLNHAIKHSSPITFVVGNESADLDSLCSAVLLAYLRTHSPTSQTLYIPLSNIPHADLSLRPELLPIISRANIKLSDFITLSDLPAQHKTFGLIPEKTRWLLVDHNALQGELGQAFGSRVVGCVDHHVEEEKVPRDNKEGEPRVVRKSGSCASLVVECCRDTWDALAKGKDTNEEMAQWNAELAALAMAPVLVDTNNLTSEAKTTDVDREAVAYLEGLIKASGREDWDTKAYFKEVSKAKQDIGGLSLEGILRKDYKQWTEGDTFKLGVSCVVKDMAFLVEKAGGEKKFFDTVRAFAKERELSICSVMTTSHQGGKFKRELFVWALNEDGAESAKKFEVDSQGSLGLGSWKDGVLDHEAEGTWRRCWWQDRVENSRKQVAPLFRTAINVGIASKASKF